MKQYNEQQYNQPTYQKSIPCRYYLNGHCRFGQNCRYSHFVIQCYLLRHAQSSFNHILSAYEHDANTNQAKQKYQLDQSYIDCGITEKGVKQIDQISFPPELKNRDKIRFDIIFVSPLERCMRTLDRCLMKHKIKAKKVIVLPGLTEVLSKICDFGSSIEQKKTKYENFDFSYVKEENGVQWQDELVDPEFRSLIQDKKSFGTRYMQILRQIFPQPLENSNRCFTRTLETLEQIRNICQIEKANKILIVSHNRIIKYIMGRRNRGRSESIENCEIKYTVI